MFEFLHLHAGKAPASTPSTSPQGVSVNPTLISLSTSFANALSAAGFIQEGDAISLISNMHDGSKPLRSHIAFTALLLNTLVNGRDSFLAFYVDVKNIGTPITAEILAVEAAMHALGGYLSTALSLKTV